MIKYILIVSATFLAGFGGGIVLSITHAYEPCPVGSYDIGDGVCKAEPTGCPYGDSIPIDSEKCVAPEVEEIEPIVPEKVEPIKKDLCEEGK